MRISGVELRKKKRLVIALTGIYGIGPTKANEICIKLGFNLAKRVHELTDEEGAKIQKYIEEKFTVEGELKRKNSDRFRMWMSIKLIKAMRRMRGLPCNGQRTHTNGSTAHKLGGLK